MYWFAKKTNKQLNKTTTTKNQTNTKKIVTNFYYWILCVVLFCDTHKCDTSLITDPFAKYYIYCPQMLIYILLIF